MQDDHFDAQLRSAILAEHIDTNALDARILAELNKSHIRRGKWIAAVGIAALLAIAIGAYFVLPSRSGAVLCEDAARDHRIEVVEHARRTWITDSSAVDALAEKQGLSIVAARMAPQQYHLERGKLCRLGGRVFVHLVYSDGAHEFSLYLRNRVPGASPMHVPMMQMAANGNASLLEGARFTAIAASADQDAAELARFAARMAS